MSREDLELFSNPEYSFDRYPPYLFNVGDSTSNYLLFDWDDDVYALFHNVYLDFDQQL